MIKGHCFSNIDDLKGFITVFAEVPRVGDHVMMKYRGNDVRVRVVSVVHNMINNKPYIIVECWDKMFIK